MTSRHYVTVLATVASSFLIAQPARAEAETTPPPLSVAVQALTRAENGAGYVVTVHNNLDVPQQVEVVQRFMRTPAGVRASDDGQAQAQGITWVIEVPPKQPRAVNSEVTFNGSFTTRSTACLRELAGQRMVDCASGDLATGATQAAAGPPWTLLALPILAAVLLAAVGYLLIRGRRRWVPAMKRYLGKHRNGLLAGAAVAAVVLIAASAFLYLTGHARRAIDLQEKPGRAVGWSGEQRSIGFGLPAVSQGAEFTLYSWGCADTETGPQCTANVAIRNTSATLQQWFARMQRLQFADGSWIGADPQLTFAANGNSDAFTAPLAIGERRLAVLVYQPGENKKLSRLELREGAFARGVAYALG